MKKISIIVPVYNVETYILERKSDNVSWMVLVII